MTHPILFTERLILRRPAAEDLNRWVAFSADPTATEHLDGPVERSVAWRLGSTNLHPVKHPAPYADVTVDAWGQSAAQWRATR